MFVNKIGQQHIDFGINCQDYGVEKDNIKLVCDGCSEGKHSEVGAKTFCYLMENGYPIQGSFEVALEVFGDTSSSIKNYLCFTILHIDNNDDSYELNYCGDGFVILQDMNDNITFEELTDGEYPKYYAYNFVDPETLKYYKEGVEIQKKNYFKEFYKNVGVASDGIRFILKENDQLKEEFINILKSGNAVKMKRFINRNQNVFKDDVTIVF